MKTLDEILKKYFMDTDGLPDMILELKQEIIDWVEKEIIGNDDRVKVRVVGQRAFIDKHVQHVTFIRNVLRSEQRKKLKEKL